jgi:hypothetical protein
VTSASFSRGKLVREASLTQADMNEVAKCRRDHNRFGFAYQIGFARLFNRFKRKFDSNKVGSYDP